MNISLKPGRILGTFWLVYLSLAHPKSEECGKAVGVLVLEFSQRTLYMLQKSVPHIY
jgi:hypothetical protein